jgi:hypothetical protein
MPSGWVLWQGWNAGLWYWLALQAGYLCCDGRLSMPGGRLCMLASYANWQAMITARLIWLSACLTMLAASLSMLLGRLGMLHMLVENVSYAECLCWLCLLGMLAGYIACAGCL